MGPRKAWSNEVPRGEGAMKPRRHIVWNTIEVELEDPFQRHWYIRQVLLHGRAEDNPHFGPGRGGQTSGRVEFATGSLPFVEGFL